MRIAICDDEQQELEKTQRLLGQYINEHPQYEINIYSFSAPIELLDYITEQGEFDVLLLDVYMPGILGTDAARELRNLGYEGEIIFITTSRDHSLDAFEVDAAQYLVKPYTEAAIFAALDKVFKRINTGKQDTIVIKTSEGIIRLAPNNVVFTETGRNNYQIIHMIQRKTVEVRMTASELFELFSKNKSFIRCGASLNLNLKYIRQISKERITFDTGEYTSYPYRAYQKLKEDFLQFQMTIDD